MDKKIWLGVIREELELLNTLATGMIEDEQLTIEEVKLAISRSMIVAKEFEMLLHTVEGPGSSQEGTEVVAVVPEASVPEEIQSPVIPSEEVAEEIIPMIERQEEIETQIETEKPAMNLIPEDTTASEVIAPIEEEEPEEELLVVEPIEPESPSSSPRPPVPPPPPAESGEHSPPDHEGRKKEKPFFKIPPFKSLNEGMTLNDRYLFQKELFGNNKASLDETVADMDKLANIQEAISYLKAHFKWMKGEASEKFILLVKRRFYQS